MIGETERRLKNNFVVLPFPIKIIIIHLLRFLNI